ncbi:hypothetical protein [Klugiella xanthotipulae]|uniref:Uncharacterized protein n=1 Tax=Klugiella xanthotipulae TaxID=244735 RepID=A0A543I694_9MICO|nr:hypothetical protein [Klugiella xanthotipulae]TQM66061.1 hypothetical protein FB466_0883 [Klugiella xanthotipulae]
MAAATAGTLVAGMLALGTSPASAYQPTTSDGATFTMPSGVTVTTTVENGGHGIPSLSSTAPVDMYFASRNGT